MKPIKLIIRKLEPMGYSWARQKIHGKVILHNSCPIRTEAQLCYYLYLVYGPGRFYIQAWQKGHEGFWVYWLGEITESGFCRDRIKNKELDKLKGEFHRAKTFEEKLAIEEEINQEKDFYKEIDKIKRKGPIGLIKSRPGELHSFEDY